MDLRAVTRSLGPIDVRSIGRDNLLAWMFLMPFVISLILRLGLPPLQSRILELTGFDLSPYHPLILGFYLVLLTPMLFGMLVGFLLLDEMDDDTLMALQVSPLSMTTYAGYRILAPMALSLVLTLLIYPVVSLVPLPLPDILLTAVVAAPGGPVLALFIAGFAENKVQGFALLKALGAVLMLPVISFFAPPGWGILFGILPTYWPLKVYWLLEAGQGAVWPHVAIGLAFQAALVGVLLRRFVRGLYG